MKFIMILLLPLILTACGIDIQNDPRDIHGIDPVFLDLVYQFENLYGRGIGDVPIQFAPLDKGTVGECIYWNTYREIKISSYWWNQLDSQGKYNVIFHELGHCVLGRGHDTDIMFGNHYPNSLMYPYVFMYAGLGTLIPHYNSELFNDPSAPNLYTSSSIRIKN